MRQGGERSPSDPWPGDQLQKAVLLGEGACERVGEQFPLGLFPKKIQGDADTVPRFLAVAMQVWAAP